MHGVAKTSLSSTAHFCINKAKEIGDHLRSLRLYCEHDPQGILRRIQILIQQIQGRFFYLNIFSAK